MQKLISKEGDQWNQMQVGKPEDGAIWGNVPCGNRQMGPGKGWMNGAQWITWLENSMFIQHFNVQFIQFVIGFTMAMEKAKD